ncbi:NAD-dependent epimerase/dehydratase family protein [Staphylococcus warneri]|uniref:3-beta hydroxysteroid dehydrogenase n=1 Tax=Staphylococcus warneri TaxID=1292 RepID=A0A2T4Q0J3_STAWA|nr:NAD(P)-dependent oxidoreductase [Staphylococcus warneri]PTI13148.1 3-beta hydroxysteroid dehydrogenase [Staphylococcus warneri]PTI16962.1 3-beta hydroxysteroid dehydrogenase [Staphylococcus warneri]PTI26433.1 3-beta hydroxysteroid dehydrogenase [Staphylococcus warneri]PTI32928.1 3-beta hydroxysteroid dehydrogenase [Staphylococcus warneri]PTI51110.1 3-beta hydroxysteroid dehydrogenase [Staphylococcus warneri]
MKPKVLLAGGTGYIGKHLSSVIENDTDLYVLSKYPKPEHVNATDMTWLQSDIFNYQDVVEAMKEIDIAIFYLDPTKNSAKLTQATARDLNLIAADNFGRAASVNHVKKLVYIPGSRNDNQTMERLGAYGVPVERTKLEIKRPHINVELQVSKYDDVRTAMKMVLPKKWTLDQVVEYFFNWLNKTKGTIVKTYHSDDHYYIYLKSKNKPLAIFKKVLTEDNLITLYLVGGKLVKSNAKKQGKLEFRLLKNNAIVLVHLYDYIPKMFWPVYYFVQAPLQGIMMRGFEVDCRIKHFQGRVQSGEKIKYTK